MADSKPVYDELIYAIGEANFEWVKLEEFVTDICLYAAVCADASFERSSAWEILFVALGNMDVRGRIATAKAIIHQMTGHDDLYDRSAALLNRIDNDLRNERNRFVHDTWHIEDGGLLVRSQRGAVITRPQARQRMIGHRQTTFASIEDVRTFTRSIKAAWKEMAELSGELTRIAIDQEQQLKPTEPHREG